MKSALPQAEMSELNNAGSKLDKRVCGLIEHARRQPGKLRPAVVSLLQLARADVQSRLVELGLKVKGK